MIFLHLYSSLAFAEVRHLCYSSFNIQENARTGFPLINYNDFCHPFPTQVEYSQELRLLLLPTF